MSIPKPTYTAPVKIDKKTTVAADKSPGLKSSDKTADSAVQNCPLKNGADKKNTEKPCDVETLSIAGGTRSVTTNLPRYRRPKPAPPKLPEVKAALMKSYDLVLEIIAMPRLTAAATKSEKGEDFHGDGVPLTISESHFGACPDKKHSKITVTPVGLGPGDPEQTVTVVQSKLPPYKVWGKALAQDASDSASLMDVWPFRDTLIKDVTVCTESCGVRLAGAVKNSFLGLVRVYRKEEWVLKISVPPLIVAKNSLEKDMGSDEITAKSERRNDFTGKDTKETTVTDKKGVKSKETSTYDAEKGKLTETEKDRGKRRTVNIADVDVGAVHKTVTTKVPKEKGEGKGKKNVTTHSIEIPITLTRNGKEFGITRLVNDILKLASQAKETLNAALDIVPKVGYSMSLDIGALEGSFSVKWGYRPDTTLDSAEYKWVMPYLDLDIDVTFLRIAFSVMFGIDVKSPGTFFVEEGYFLTFVLKVQLTLSVTAGLKASAHLTGAPDSKDDDNAPINSKADVTFEGTVALTLVGESVKAVAGTNIDVKAEGTCYYGLKRGVWVDWTLSRSAWIVYAYAQYANRDGDGGSRRCEREVWPENKEWKKGTLFK